MQEQPRTEPIAPGEWLALAAVIVVFILLRLPLLTEPGLHLGWNSDAAIFGFMAEAIQAGRDLPIFFWGQSYMGPLTPFLTAAVGFALHAVGFVTAPGPLALRIAAALETLAGILFYWSALRRAFDRSTAMVVALWLAIGPAYVFFFTIAPIGAEQMFVLSAILFWYAVRTELTRPRHWFVFGILCGLGWWINQGVVFAICGAIAVVNLRSQVWAAAWPEPHVVDRLFLRDFLHRQADRVVRLLVCAVHIVLIAWMIDGALFALGLPVPAFFLAEPLLEPVIAFVIFQIVVEILFGRDLRAGLAILARDFRSWLVPASLFAAGAVVGYAPVIVGGVLHLYPRSYGLSVPLLPLAGMAGHVMTALRSDFWSFIGSNGEPVAALVAIGVVPLFAIAVLRHRTRVRDLVTLRAADYGSRGMAAATMISCVLFYVISSRAHPGSVRYIVSALPLIYAFAAREMWNLRPRLLAVGVAAAIAFGLAIPRIGQARRVAGGSGEQYANFVGGFDPRPVLHAIESEGYSICYADYWIGYKLQWVSDGRVRFIPFHSYDRTPGMSRVLDAAPGPKCYVDENGRVRPFNRGEFNEATMRAARQRLMKLRAGGE